MIYVLWAVMMVAGCQLGFRLSALWFEHKKMPEPKFFMWLFLWAISLAGLAMDGAGIVDVNAPYEGWEWLP